MTEKLNTLLLLSSLNLILSLSPLSFPQSGLGDSAEGFSDIAEKLNAAMPYVKFLVPTAGKRPVTISGGMSMNAWYDITGLTDRASEDCDGIDHSVAKVRAKIPVCLRDCVCVQVSARPMTAFLSILTTLIL